MTITPFLSLNLRGKKDALMARRRARRVANLLSYEPHEQTCIAAGVFVVACQALALFGKARLHFQIEHHQLHVFAQDAKHESHDPARVAANRIIGLFREPDSKALYRLAKPLPAEKNIEELDLGWLVKKVEETACNRVFDEITRQNQEVLTLLHALRLYQADSTQKEEKPKTPHAA